MPDVNLIIVLALVTFAMAVGFMLFSLYRTRRDKRDNVKSAVPREDVAEARKRPGNASGL
ncbi:hypothetical protein [Hoeflea olei]|nr:hypothetical protein [Hoeflea olei]